MFCKDVNNDILITLCFRVGVEKNEMNGRYWEGEM
jgi:hypothetical protein